MATAGDGGGSATVLPPPGSGDQPSWGRRAYLAALLRVVRLLKLAGLKRLAERVAAAAKYAFSEQERTSATCLKGNPASALYSGVRPDNTQFIWRCTHPEVHCYDFYSKAETDCGWG